MKTLTKVVLILNMVFGFWAIFPLIFGGITLSKLEHATRKDDLVVWGVLDLFFCSLLSGILVLCLQESDLKKA